MKISKNFDIYFNYKRFIKDLKDYQFVYKIQICMI